MENLFIYETCKLKTVLIVSICVKTVILLLEAWFWRLFIYETCDWNL